MTPEKKMPCRVKNPNVFDRFLRFLFGVAPTRHAWIYSAHESRRFVYYVRQCDCGAEEIQNAGPMGDKQWRPLADGFRNEWECADFASSTQRGFHA